MSYITTLSSLTLCPLHLLLLVFCSISPHLYTVYLHYVDINFTMYSILSILDTFFSILCYNLTSKSYSTLWTLYPAGPQVRQSTHYIPHYALSSIHLMCIFHQFSIYLNSTTCHKTKGSQTYSFALLKSNKVGNYYLSLWVILPQF